MRTVLIPITLCVACDDPPDDEVAAHGSSEPNVEAPQPTTPTPAPEVAETTACRR